MTLAGRLRLISLLPLLLVMIFSSYFVYTYYNEYRSVEQLQEELPQVHKQTNKDRAEAMRQLFASYIALGIKSDESHAIAKLLHTRKMQERLVILDRLLEEALYKSREVLLFALLLWIAALALSLFGFLFTKELTANMKNLEDILSKVAHDSDEGKEAVAINFDKLEGIEEAYKLLERIIEETKREKMRAEEASLAKSMFLANMSHEIRTPLNGIVGFTELLRETKLSSEQREFVDIIEASSDNLLEIINNILDLSKVESNKFSVESILFDPIREFESAVELYAVKAHEKAIELACFIDPALQKPLYGDPTKIKEVLVNLLSNAIKFTHPKGSVIVRIEMLPGGSKEHVRIRFVVEDSGVGVSHEQKARIFEAFSQADGSITRKYGGTGLGLTISARFVELMGGQLDLESETDKGTRFFFTLELKEGESVVASNSDAYRGVEALIVQSSQERKISLDFLQEYLGFYGVESRFVTQQEAIEQEGASLVFVDYESCEKSELEDLLARFGKALVVITKAYSMPKDALDKIPREHLIYEPINKTKTQRLLEHFGDSQEADGRQKEEENTPIKQEYFDADVLVVEDNVINQKLMQKTLQNMGLHVAIASNGLEALAKRRAQRYALIFMDIQMPILDGIEATREILEYEADYNESHVPIVALTANALKGDKERFLEAGLDAYTTKPLIREEIVALLHKYLPQKEQQPLKREDILFWRQGKFEKKLFATLLQSLGYSYRAVDSFAGLKSALAEGCYGVVCVEDDGSEHFMEELRVAVGDQTGERACHTALVLIKGPLTKSSLAREKLFAAELPTPITKEHLHATLQKFLKK